MDGSQHFSYWFWALALLALFLMTSHNCVSGVTHNATIACTRGLSQRNHVLSCTNGETVLPLRVFYGALPSASGCSDTSPSSNCCPNSFGSIGDCVFQNNDKELVDIMHECSGSSSCQFPGTSQATGAACSSPMYPSMTSFSFVEYECLPQNVRNHICSDTEEQFTGEVYLDSNHLANPGPENDHCVCVVTSECDTTLTVVALDLQLEDSNNASVCLELLYLTDVRDTNVITSIDCANQSLAYKEVFTSKSNMVYISKYRLQGGSGMGKVLIKLVSSDQNAQINVTCGSQGIGYASHLEDCPSNNSTNTTDATTITSPSTTPSTITSTTTTPSTTTMTTTTPSTTITTTTTTPTTTTTTAITSSVATTSSISSTTTASSTTMPTTTTPETTTTTFSTTTTSSATTAASSSTPTRSTTSGHSTIPNFTTQSTSPSVSTSVPTLNPFITNSSASNGNSSITTSSSNSSSSNNNNNNPSTPPYNNPNWSYHEPAGDDYVNGWTIVGITLGCSAFVILVGAFIGLAAAHKQRRRRDRLAKAKLAENSTTKASSLGNGAYVYNPSMKSSYKAPFYYGFD